MSRKYFFGFRSPDLPFDIRFWTRGFLLVMRSRKAGFPFATRARKRELSIQEVRIENDSDQKCSKTKCFQSFSENHFFPRVKNFIKSKILIVFLETTFLQCSCYSDHYEPKLALENFSLKINEIPD